MKRSAIIIYMRRIVWFLFGVVVIAGFLSSPIDAATSGDSGSLRVVVTDAHDSKPLWLASVTVLGPRTRFALSTRIGVVIFPVLVPGVYRLRVDHAGYDRSEDHTVTIVAGQQTDLALVMKQTVVKVIGKTAGKSSGATITVNDQSLAPQIDGSLNKSVSSIPGLTIGPSGDLSYGGFSSRQNVFEVNGVPVSLPGQALALQTIAGSAFGSASVSPGAGGGAVLNFVTRSPTLAWLGDARGIDSTFDGNDLQFQETGTVGDLGVSLSHADNTTASMLDGQTYFDSSGLEYRHHASSWADGTAAQFRLETSSSNSIIASSTLLNSDVPLTCNLAYTKFPCGYGPVNEQHGSILSDQLRDVAQLGTAILDFTLFDNKSLERIDQSGYFVLGQHEPSVSASDSSEFGFLMKANVPLSVTRSVSVSSTDYSTTTSALGGAFGPIVPTMLNSTRREELSASIPVIAGSLFNLGISAGFNAQYVPGSSIKTSSWAIDSNYSLRRWGDLRAQYNPGAIGSPSAAYNDISAPSLFNFNCGAGIAVGTGPSSASPGSSNTNTTVGWSYNPGPSFSLDAEVSRSVQTDALVSAIVNYSAIPSLPISTTYLAATSAQYSTFCGGSRQLTTGDLFFQIYGKADRAIYQNIIVRSSLAVGSKTTLFGSFAVSNDRAFGSDPLLFGPTSTVENGRQLPNVPPASVEFAVSSYMTKTVQAEVRSSWESMNNPYNLHAFATVDIGILASVRPGILALSVTNLAATDSFRFASSRGAAALPTRTDPFPTVAYPLSPRTISIGLRIGVGPPTSTRSFDIPNDQYSRHPGPSYDVPVSTLPLDTHPPADPFGINPLSVFCGKKDTASARRTLSEWQAYSSQIESLRSTAGYPEAVPPRLFGPIQFTYHRFNNTYAITVDPAPGATIQRFLDALQTTQFCARIHFDAAFADRYLREGVSGPLSLLPIYMPEVGIYQIYHATVASSPENLSYVEDPSEKGDGRDLTLRSSSSCSPEIRPAAADLISTLKQFADQVYRFRRVPRSPEGFLFLVHRNTPTWWIEIRDTTGNLAELDQCLFIASISANELKHLEVGASPEPSLNYTPALGIYLPDDTLPRTRQ